MEVNVLDNSTYISKSSYTKIILPHLGRCRYIIPVMFSVTIFVLAVIILVIDFHHVILKIRPSFG